VHLGDDFFAVGFPFIDLASGGSVKGTIEALEKLIPTLPADAKLIPGHGEVAGVEALKKVPGDGLRRRHAEPAFDGSVIGPSFRNFS
jgi:glyoxylase-like metal-dependent hydrolase (beta-lactamase superfamily II)